MECDLLIREAEVQDASALIALLDQIGQESNFTSLDENGIEMTQSEMQHFIDKQSQSDNQITLLAFLMMNWQVSSILQRINVREFDILVMSSWALKKHTGGMVLEVF